jgi:hypothetical protein
MNNNFTLKTLFTFLMFFAYTIINAQTLSPWLDDMNSIGGVNDQWRLVTGQPNAGSHNGEMCYNVVGTYLDDEFYSFESDTLDLFQVFVMVISSLSITMIVLLHLGVGTIFQV